jgi:hypothetical protein
MAAAAAAAPLRQRSYFKAGGKNTGEHYNASVALNPFRYKPGSNYESSNAGNGGNSRPQLRIPKAKYAGEIVKHVIEYDDEMRSLAGRLFHQAIMPENNNMKNKAIPVEFEQSLAYTLEKVHADKADVLQLEEEQSIGYIIVRQAIDEINGTIPTGDRSRAYASFKKQVLEALAFLKSQNESQKGNNSGGFHLSTPRKSRKQRKTRRHRK